MGVLLRKHHGLYYLTGITKLALVALIISFSIAALNTVWAVYLDSFLHSEVYVGYVSSFLTIIAFVSYFVFIPLIERTNKTKIFAFSLIAFAVIYYLFALNKNFYIFLVIAIILTLLQTLRMTSFGIIIKDSSPKKRLSNNIGLIYSFINTAWVITPLVVGYIILRSGMKGVFYWGAAFFIIGFLVFIVSGAKGKKGSKKVHSGMIRNFIDFFRDKERIVAYALRGGVNLWWMLIYLFIPLMIIRSELAEYWVGYFLFAVAVPLIVFEYYFAKKANKSGFKKIFKTGYLFVAVISAISFFTSNIYLILGLLSFASIGMAMLEPTTEAYFFDILKSSDKDRFYGPYETSLDVGGFIAKIFASTLLIFLPFKFLFLLFAGFMFVFFLVSFKAKNVVENK